MLLYHGSNIEVIEPRLVEQPRGLDFGSGFYLTTNEVQAIRFSEIVTDRRKNGKVTVSVYEFDMETAEKTLSVNRFMSADSSWLRFIIDNRLKTYKGAFYDIVIGAVADDTVMPAIQAFLGGIFNEEATIVALKANNLVDQVCLKSAEALSLLIFNHSFEINTVPRINKSISPVIAMILPGIAEMLMKNRDLSLKEAYDLLYNSQLYKAMEDEKTKVWRLGYPILYDLLEEELATGSITWPEEQI